MDEGGKVGEALGEAGGVNVDDGVKVTVGFLIGVADDVAVRLGVVVNVGVAGSTLWTACV